MSTVTAVVVVLKLGEWLLHWLHDAPEEDDSYW